MKKSAEKVPTGSRKFYCKGKKFMLVLFLFYFLPPYSEIRSVLESDQEFPEKSDPDPKK